MARVGQHQRVPVLAAEQVVELRLEPAEPDVVEPDVAEQRRHQLAVRVVTAALVAEPDAIEVEGVSAQEARRLRLIFAREGAPAEAAAAPSVAISGFSFQPASLEVAAGTTVTWENEDGAPHTATSSDGTFDSGRLSTGYTFEWTFDTAGSFAYACAIHPSMTGTIVVS